MKDFRINWQLPAQPLGPAVREQQEKECPFLSFETGDHTQRGAAWKDTHSNQTQRGLCADERTGSLAADIAAGCARPGSGGKQLEQVSSPAAPPFKVGDRVLIKMSGDIETITAVDDLDPFIPVQAAGFWWGAGEIELIQEKEEDPLLRKEDGIVREPCDGEVWLCRFKGGITKREMLRRNGCWVYADLISPTGLEWDPLEFLRMHV